MSSHPYRLFAARALAGLALMFGSAHAAELNQPNDKPDLVLRGEINGRDHQTYRNVPFDVPVGVTRITVQFDYTGRDERTTIDFGLVEPDGVPGSNGIRGWSGGNKQLVTVSATDATPSYLAGPIQPGRWNLMLGVPNIRKTSRSEFTAKVWFGHADDPAWKPAVLNPTLRREARWYRGDLHTHTAHSDGYCASQTGQRVPCPLFLTAQSAVQKGLDFIAITEHNTTSHTNAMRELQPFFDRLLMMPGRELTTFTGHANLFGTTAPVDFRVDGKQVSDWNTVLRQIEPLQGLLSINHPVRPSGEDCMGCGWTPTPAVDMSKIHAVEVVNGDDAGTPLSGLPFWDQQLALGWRLTAIGGSDNHQISRATSPSPTSHISEPTTVVHAKELSMPAILAGMRAGHVFVDVEGSRDRLLELNATSGSQKAMMGDAIKASAGTRVRFDTRAVNVAGAQLRVLLDGQPFLPSVDTIIAGDDQALGFDWTSDGKHHWLRIEVQDATSGKPLLIGNPIYLNPPRS